MATQAIDPRMELEQHLHMFRQMAKIRAFEEQVNELYKGAKMPGLAHLYVGQEAVAVGVCEALHRDDFITSTHRGHGHCLAKGASVNRMFAELLGKEAGYCLVEDGGALRQVRFRGDSRLWDWPGVFEHSRIDDSMFRPSM